MFLHRVEWGQKTFREKKKKTIEAPGLDLGGEGSWKTGGELPHAKPPRKGQNKGGGEKKA